MCLYPEVQRKAQAELDTVLEGRLPYFSDRQNLPYINAMIKESMRWQQVAPLGLYIWWDFRLTMTQLFLCLGVGHMNSEADEYEGYYIPQGTIVMGSVWYERCMFTCTVLILRIFIGQSYTTQRSSPIHLNTILTAIFKVARPTLPFMIQK